MSTRKARFAGSWYPGKREKLLAELERCTPADVEAAKAVGIVAPHAGYVYSGSTAGAVYARVEVPDRVVILCPNHTNDVKAVAVWSEGEWLTPLGPAPVDAELAATLLAKCPAAEDHEGAHAQEHSLELQLPFVQVRNPKARILPVSIGSRRPATLQSLGSALAEVVGEASGEVLIVASSDMTHFETAASAKAQDQKALERARALDPEGLLAVVEGERISMCGAAPTAAMLWAARQLGATNCELVDYTHSGMVTGDDSHVVAYAGLIVA